MNTTTPAQATWCLTCGNPVENGECACWCHLADALQRYLGRDFDASADEAARLWDELDEDEKTRVWRAEYAETHDAEIYPDTRSFAPAGVREQDRLDHPHDEPCPRCGRRQWAIGPQIADPANPTDEEQQTCGSCGFNGSKQER